MCVFVCLCVHASSLCTYAKGHALRSLCIYACVDVLCIDRYCICIHTYIYVYRVMKCIFCLCVYDCYLFVLFIAVPYGPQVLTLSSDPKVTQEVAVESGVTGFCVEKAGETAKKCTPSFQTPHAWVAMEHNVRSSPQGALC